MDPQFLPILEAKKKKVDVSKKTAFSSQDLFLWGTTKDYRIVNTLMHQVSLAITSITSQTFLNATMFWWYIKKDHFYKQLGITEMTKIVRFAFSTPLFNVGCKFACSFLASNTWHSIIRLGTTLYWTRGRENFGYLWASQIIL